MLIVVEALTFLSNQSLPEHSAKLQKRLIKDINEKNWIDWNKVDLISMKVSWKGWNISDLI